MATYLHRLGGWAFTHRKRVLGIWALVLVAVFACASAFSGETNDGFEVPGTESQQAQELLEGKYPAASGDQARMVFTAPEGTTLADPANQDAIQASLAQAAKGEEVEQVIDPYEAGTISKDGTIGFADVIYPKPAADLSDESKDELEASAEPAEAAGLGVEWSGGVIQTESESGSETTGILIAFFVLAITLASLLSAGMPLITAIIGVLIGSTAITALTGVIEISETAPILAVMLGLAVGIDYSLFILSRHRQNMGEGMSPHEAAAKAVGTAGSAVVFAGTTVIIALVGLVVVGIPFLTVMGLAAAGTVAVAVVIAVTLTPALLGFAGERVTRMNRVLGYRPRRREAGQDKLSVRYARWVTRHPKAVLRRGRRAAGRGRDSRTRPEARAAGRRLAADGHDRAPGLRPADRGVRPRIQRSAHGGRARARPEQAGAGGGRDQGHRGAVDVPRCCRGQSRKSRTRPATSPWSR